MDNPVNAYMQMDETDVTLQIGEKITRTATTISDVPVIYTSSDESIATVDPVTGQVTAVDGGTVTITAKVEANEYYNADAKSYKVTCEKNMIVATPEDIGRMICTNGHIHKLEGETFCQAQRVAMVAYVGDKC